MESLLLFFLVGVLMVVDIMLLYFMLFFWWEVVIFFLFLFVIFFFWLLDLNDKMDFLILLVDFSLIFRVFLKKKFIGFLDLLLNMIVKKLLLGIFLLFILVKCKEIFDDDFLVVMFGNKFRDLMDFFFRNVLNIKLGLVDEVKEFILLFKFGN